MTPGAPLTPGAYLRLRRVACGLSLDEVAAALTCEPRIDAAGRADWIGRIEADAVPAAFSTLAALRQVVAFDWDVLERLELIAVGEQLPAPALCVECGAGEGVIYCEGAFTDCSWAVGHRQARAA